MNSVFPQRGRASSQESRFNSAQLHNGQPAFLPRFHVTFQPPRILIEASVQQNSLIWGVREASKPRSFAPTQRCKDGRAQPQPYGCSPRYDSCTEQGWLNCLACVLQGKRLHNEEWKWIIGAGQKPTLTQQEGLTNWPDFSSSIFTDNNKLLWPLCYGAERKIWRNHHKAHELFIKNTFKSFPSGIYHQNRNINQSAQTTYHTVHRGMHFHL